LKNLSLYYKKFSYNSYSFKNLIVVKRSYFSNLDIKDCLDLNKISSYAKLIFKQRKKIFFFDKFLLKWLMSYNNLSAFQGRNIDTINKLLRTFLISGKKVKSYNSLVQSFFKIYAVVGLESYANISNNYHYFREFLFNKELNKELNGLTAILNWLFFWYQPIFCVKCSLVPKKYRKKLKKKYVYTVSYIDPKKRKNISLRWMLHFLDSFSSYKFHNRLFLLFSDLIFNFKKSLMYERKVKMYKKMFKV